MKKFWISSSVGDFVVTADDEKAAWKKGRQSLDKRRKPLAIIYRIDPA